MNPRVVYYSDIENAYDDPERVGRLAGTIDALRDERTVVVGTGDDTGPGVLAMQTQGHQSLDFFRAVEPEFETFGNHDFDYGTDPLRELVADSPQQWLSANIYKRDGAGKRKTGQQFADADPTAVVERAGERIGFVGVTDPQTPELSAGATDLVLTDPVAEVREVLPDLRERADHVVVLAHLREENEREIAALDGVDAILGGHIHVERHERVDGTLLLRPNANGEVVWAVELGDEATATRRAVPDGPRHEGVAEALRNRMEATGLTEVVATVDDPILRERDRRYGGECRVANLVTDAYRWATGADVGFLQNGSLRDGPPLSGNVTVADLVGVAPFGGELEVVPVSGAQLRDLVSTVLAPEDAPTGGGRKWWGHFGGLRVDYDPDANAVRDVRLEDGPLDPDAQLTVAANAFDVRADPTPMDPDDVVATWGVQYDAIVEYAREAGLDVALDGRLSPVGSE
jgi:2',3'-cyclic-nucleotide 2'-phosphodiesterase (5'-nucleotidase family)